MDEERRRESQTGTMAIKRVSLGFSAREVAGQFVDWLFVSPGWSSFLFSLWDSAAWQMFCRSFGIRAARGPIGWRKRDSPKSRRRLFELNTHISLARLFGAEMDHAADKLLHGLDVFHAEKLANLHRQGQLDERSVRIHDDGMSLFRGHVGSWSFSEHHDR